jgi:hypothetical protein
VEHRRIVVGRIKEFFSSAKDNLGKQIYTKDGLSSEENIKQPGNVSIRLDIVGIHGKCAREGVERLGSSQMPPKARIRSVKNIGYKAKLGNRWGKGWEHEVANAEKGKASNERCPHRGIEDKKKDLADVMVALKVAEEWVPSKDLDYQIRQFRLASR